MGIKTRIEDLGVDLIASGKSPEKIARRFIEAGLNLSNQFEPLHPELRIVPNFDGDGLFAGDYHVSRFTKGPMSSINVEEKDAALRFAGETFDFYAQNHYDKEPPQIEKARRNVEAATKCYMAAGIAYAPPTEMLESGFELPESSQEGTVQPDSALPAVGSALKLLVTLYGIESADLKVLGIQVHVDDQPILATLVELGFVTRDDVYDTLLVTTKGREAIGIRPKGLPSLPVEVAELTGNIAEAELAARYVDGKVAGCERHIREGTLPENAESLRYVAAVLGEIAHEFRAGLHLPAVTIEGRVIPYNEERSGLVHADGLQVFFDDVYARNVKAGWWTDILTGEPKKRNVGELFMLMVTELAEAYKAYVNNENDDKLPQYPGVGVEMGDLLIRIGDFCGAVAAGNVVEYSPVMNPGEEMFAEIVCIAERYEAIRKTPEANGQPETGDFMPVMLVGPMVDAKLLYNSKREDHRIENRLKPDGKKT